jgi:hypothetical protein
MATKDRSDKDDVKPEKAPQHRHDSDTRKQDAGAQDARKNRVDGTTDWQKPPRPKGK